MSRYSEPPTFISKDLSRASTVSEENPINDHIVHIFRTGTGKDNFGNDTSITAEDIQRMVSVFDANKKEVPVYFEDNQDHPQGYIKSLFAKNGNLYAVITLYPAIKNEIKAGKYKYPLPVFDAKNSSSNQVNPDFLLDRLLFLKSDDQRGDKRLTPISLNQSLVKPESHEYSEYSENNSPSMHLHNQILYFQEGTESDYADALQLIKSFFQDSTNQYYQDATSNSDEETDQLHQRILQFQKENNCTYKEAYCHIVRGN